MVVFLKRISQSNVRFNRSAEQEDQQEELSLLTVQLISTFLFHTGFHTKKALRGPASEWYEALSFHFKEYSSVRQWFAGNILLNHPHRFVHRGYPSLRP